MSEVTAAIKALAAEPFYENGRKELGISVRFLARMTILQYAAGILDNNNPLVIEADAMLRASLRDAGMAARYEERH